MSLDVAPPPARESSESRGGIQFRYARSSNGSLIDVTKLTREKRSDFAPYTCIGCGEKLIARLGRIRVKHFMHATEGTCNRETRLHMTGKALLFERLSRCIASRTPFVLNRQVSEQCTRTHAVTGKVCLRVQEQEINLTKYYSKALLEPQVDGFIPDILLSSDDDSNQLFIEIAVTHRCEPAKIESGVRILEIELSGDADLQLIAGGVLSAEDSRITLYNFKNPIERDLCGGLRRTRIALECAILRRETSAEANSTRDEDNASDRENLTFRDRNERPDHRATALIKDNARAKLFDESSVRNCFNCRQHRLNRNESPPIFCRRIARAVSCLEAAECPSYSPFGSAAEADRADVKNATELSLSRVSARQKHKTGYAR